MDVTVSRALPATSCPRTEVFPESLTPHTRTTAQVNHSNLCTGMHSWALQNVVKKKIVRGTKIQPDIISDQGELPLIFICHGNTGGRWSQETKSSRLMAKIWRYLIRCRNTAPRPRRFLLVHHQIRARVRMPTRTPTSTPYSWGSRPPPAWASSYP